MNNMFTNEVLPWELNNATNDTATATIEPISETVEEIADYEAETIEVQADTYPIPEADTTNELTEGTVPDVDFGGDDVQVTEKKIETPAPETIESVVQATETSVSEAETSSDTDTIADVTKKDKVVSNLTSVPASDLNFIGALEEATLEELETALAVVKESPRSSTKVTKIEARIKKISKEEKKASKETTETTDSEENATEAANEEEVVIPPAIIFEDTFNKIDQEGITDKDKSIMYLMEHYKINPDTLNALLEGDFGKVWGSIKELNNENLAVKEKLAKELGKADDDRIKVVKYLVEKAKDVEFAKQILLEHKDFNRCFKYITDRVRKAFTNKAECIQVNDDTVYAWAVEYYMLDDYDQVMKEREEEAERKRKAEEAKKKAAEKKKKTTKKSDSKKAEAKPEAKPDEKATETKTEAQTVVKPEEKVDTTPDATSEVKTDETLVVPTVTEEEQKEVDKAIETAEAEKKNEGDSESGFSAIQDSFGQLTFSF